MVMDDDVGVKGWVPRKLHRFATMKRHHDHLSLSRLIRALLTAYVLGDIEITPDGYRIRRAQSEDDPSAVILHDDGSREVFTLDDAALHREIMAQGFHGYRRREPGWGTRDLARYLTKQLGQRVSDEAVRIYLRKNGYQRPKGQNRWSWPEGAQDPQVQEVLKGMARYGVWSVNASQRRATNLSEAELNAAKRKSSKYRREREDRARRDAAKRSES